MKEIIRKNNYTILVGLLLLALATLFIWRQESHRHWKDYQRRYAAEHGADSLHIGVRTVVPTLTGQPELCLTCHVGIEEISASHPVDAFGCIICHGGERLALDKKLVHKTLRGGRNPSDFSVVQQSCGQSPAGVACHSGYRQRWHNMIDRSQRSLQSTAAGAIAHTRFTFGLQTSPAPIYGTRHVRDDTVAPANYPAELASLYDKLAQDSLADKSIAMEVRFAGNCLSGGCHLNTTAKSESYYYRSTGCAACHYLYTRDALYQGNDITIDKTEPGHGTVHRLTTAIPYWQCNHCHNRGIYSMKQMRFIDRQDVHPDTLAFLSREKRRAKEYYIPLAQYSQCEISLDCIDCHTHNEVMGDGHIAPNKKAAVEMECQTCHGTINAPPKWTIIRSTDQRDVFIAGFNAHITVQPGDTVGVTSRGTILPALQKKNGQWQLTSKVTGERFVVPLVFGSHCEQIPKEQKSHSCHQCHDISDR